MSASLYSNENIPLPLVVELRKLGYNVLTTHEALQSNRGVPDDEVLTFATMQARAVLTYNRRHFQKLHRMTRGEHAGMVCCKVDGDHAALAARIDTEIRAVGGSLAGREIRVNRPG